MLALYRILTFLLAPVIYLYLLKRRKLGKEDPQRLRERMGYGAFPRPEGTLVWMHAASVGESTSVMPLVQRLCERYPSINFLITTGTVTSAKLLQTRLPERAYHHFIPADTPLAVKRFVRHWKPNLALWVESELWPNLVLETHAKGCPMVLLNARLSDKSFALWQQYRFMIRKLLSCFSLVLAQSEEDARRYRHLGASDVKYLGNLKFDAPALPDHVQQREVLQSAIAERPVWLAASTHPGEETMIADAHKSLCDNHPGLLTILVPRHPERGAAIAEELRGKGFRIALRSRGELPNKDTDLYIADTLGELGIFYRVATIVFVGGSLVPHGGQNPLEPARLGCAVMCGPYMDNFTDICQELESEGGILRVENNLQLGRELDALLKDKTKQEALASAARKMVEGKQGIVDVTVEELSRFLAPATPTPY